MMTQHQWRWIGRSVAGVSHKRADPPKPNQDAIYGLPEIQQGSSLVLMVADGHGSSKAFRSELGSRLAVTSVGDYLWNCFCHAQSEHSYAAVYDLTQEQLPERLVRVWNEQVQAHLDDHPFSAEEMKLLPTWEQVVEAKKFHRSPQPQVTQTIVGRYAYGSTLLGVVITDMFIMYLQLGDGDMICVDPDGTVYRPLAKDPSLIANETTSLCMVDAWTEFRIKITPNTGRSPALVLVSTDGYSNSFSSERDYLQVGSDYLNWIREEGLASVEPMLEEILNETSEKGSGDDVTLGIVARITPDPAPERSQGEADSEFNCADPTEIEVKDSSSFEGLEAKMSLEEND